MAITQIRISTDWRLARRHLRRDAILAPLIQRVGHCSLEPRRDYFVALCHAICAQQLSTIVATVIFGRFKLLFPRSRPTPEGVLALPEATLRSVGFSRQKAAYLRDLATHFAAGAIPTRRFTGMSDEEIIEALLPVKGVGRWTCEMFLIFVLNRPDVLPVDDLGLRNAARKTYGLATVPDREELIALGEAWRPWRSIATWYLWRGLA